MNQQERDETEARDYAGKNVEQCHNDDCRVYISEKFIKETYLAALQAERTRKSEVVGMGFDEWIKKHNPWCNKDSLYTDSDMQAAYAQGERAKEKEVEAQIEHLLKISADHSRVMEENEELKRDLEWALEMVNMRVDRNDINKAQSILKKHKLGGESER